MRVRIVEKVYRDYLSVNRFKLSQVLTVRSVFEVIEMDLKVDEIVSPILFNGENIWLVKLVSAPEKEYGVLLTERSYSRATQLGTLFSLMGQW